MIKGLGSSYVACLQSKTQRVPLVVAELLVGQFDVTQAVLKPRSVLEVGEQYELVIEGKGSKGNVIRWQEKSKMQYAVVAGADETTPAWETLPTESGKRYEEMGCGPAIHVAFASTVHDESEYLVKASVKNLASGRITAYYLQPDSMGYIHIGHGMCGGAYMLEKGKNFSVVFALMDASGNSTSQTDKALQFTKPEGSYGRR